MNQRVEEMLSGWDIDEKYKYLCFYRQPSASSEVGRWRQEWRIDFSDSKKELLEKERTLFLPKDIVRYCIYDETFRLVLDAIATDPQLVLCADGEYRICRYPSKWGWVGIPTTITKQLWRELSHVYRLARANKHRLHRNHMICLNDEQFAVVQRLIGNAFDDVIDTHKIKDEF